MQAFYICYISRSSSTKLQSNLYYRPPPHNGHLSTVAICVRSSRMICSYFKLATLATTPQWPVNSVPEVADVERFDCPEILPCAREVIKYLRTSRAFRSPLARLWGKRLLRRLNTRLRAVSLIFQARLIPSSFLSLICIILTCPVARRISRTKTDFS